MRLVIVSFIAVVAACGFVPLHAADAPGLKLTLEGGGATDARAARLVALRVAADSPVSPFIPAGAFKATFEGTITQRIKDTYTFSALGGGALKVTVNDAVALDVSGDDLSGKSGEPVVLKKGKNTFRAEYTSPKSGEGSLRLLWQPKDLMPESVPPTIFSHDADDAKLVDPTKLRRGRELVAELRCIKCHASDVQSAGGAMRELAQDAPSLLGIGGRVKQAWLARWINDPHAYRPTTAMPRVFASPGEGNVSDEAAHLAAYLVTDGAVEQKAEEASAEAANAGAHLFTNLGCVGCHVAADVKEPKQTPQPRVPLAHVPEKWHFAALVEYLKKPEQHYQWTKMPNFRLSDDEANQLAAYLGGTTKQTPPLANAGDAAKGKELFQSSGCINCHASKLDNTFKTKPLAELTDLSRGCLAKDAATRGKAPDFPITEDSRAALTALAATKFASLRQDNTIEFAERQVVALNCRACHPHDRVDDTWSGLKDEIDALMAGVPAEKEEGESPYFGDQTRPPLTWLGEKLRPQWAAAFIGGTVDYKPRPWLRARMPGFPARARAMAQGLALSHGCAPATPAYGKPDEPLAEIGKKLVGRQGGLSCVQCHGVGEMKAFSPFEAPAVNFAHVSDRLTREYYDRWVWNPQRVLPGTRMPKFADGEGKTALKDILDGDARKQFDAIWNYVLHGKNIAPPE